MNEELEHIVVFWGVEIPGAPDTFKMFHFEVPNILFGDGVNDVNTVSDNIQQELSHIPEIKEGHFDYINISQWNKWNIINTNNYEVHSA